MSYLERAGARLFFQSHGKRERKLPLFFVHGFACSGDDWQPQVDYFSAHHHTLTCDLRGHGRSSGESEDCTIEVFGSDLNAILAALNLPPAILIGHSMGCRVVLQAFLESPKHVAGIILVDGSRLATGDPRLAEQATGELIQSVGYIELIRRSFEEMFVEGSDADLKNRILRRTLTFPIEIGVALSPRLSAWDAQYMEHALSRMDVPLLVIQSTTFNADGVRIPLPPDETSSWIKLIQKHIPTAQIKIVSSAGHFSMLENPEQVNRIMDTFIKQFSS